MRQVELFAVLVLGAVCGCRSVGVNDDAEMSKTLADYLELCREMSVGEKPSAECPDDWMIGAGVTTWERKADYRIVYADAKYVSFRAEEYAYNGGAHGNTKITVGTIDRKTGKVLKASDLIPSERKTEVLAALQAGVVKQIGGKENLQGEVKIIDNCFVAKDGIHFVYNEYEVACYAAGTIEVVVK